jgi:hypothetical protein
MTLVKQTVAFYLHILQTFTAAHLAIKSKSLAGKVNSAS